MRIFKGIITQIFQLSIILLFTSCATMISGTKQKVEIYSIPDSCTVWLNGKNTHHITPCTLKVQRKLKPTLYNAKNEQNYILRKEGYYDFEVKDKSSINPVIAVNAASASIPIFYSGMIKEMNDEDIFQAMILPPLIGLVTDFISGSFRKYDKRIFAELKLKSEYKNSKTYDDYVQASNIITSKKGLALCIGNGMYETTGILINPENDAKDIANALERLGFEVMKIENADQATMKKVIDEFGKKLKKYDVGLFFYAGHGVQAKGFNYLIPVDAEINSENDIEYSCVNAGRVLAKMEDAGSTTNIVIMDACRNNPFERSWTRSATGRGLALMDAPIGSLIGFATSPGSTASDGVADNGLYTSAILEYIGEAGLNILEIFQKVRKKVRENSGGEQVPWESTSLEGNFYFIEE